MTLVSSLLFIDHGLWILLEKIFVWVAISSVVSSTHSAHFMSTSWKLRSECSVVKCWIRLLSEKNVRSNISRNVRRTQSFINCNKNVIINKKSDFKRYRRFYFSVQNGSGDAIYPFVYPFIHPIHSSVYQQPKNLQIRVFADSVIHRKPTVALFFAHWELVPLHLGFRFCILVGGINRPVITWV